MRSAPFRIIVVSDDENEQEFFIQSMLLASLSPSLDALVNGGMKEARERCVAWHMDEQIFVFFIMFSYTTNYNVAGCLPVKLDQTIEAECIDEARVRKLGELMAGALIHIKLMIFVDYHAISSLYVRALCQLKFTYRPSGEECFTTGARAKLVETLGKLDAPAYVIADAMKRLIRKAKSLWEHEGFKDILDQYPDLKSEFLNIVMSNMAIDAR
jgi:hypothetical protein